MCSYKVCINGNLSYLRLVKADSYWCRLKGWMFKKTVSFDDALWIEPCNSIHTFFMNFPIDALFIDSQGYVIRCCPAIANRKLRAAWRASSVIELSVGTIATLGIVDGDLIELKEIYS